MWNQRIVNDMFSLTWLTSQLDTMVLAGGLTVVVVLRVFDREKTGFMSARDFRNAMTSLGESMTDVEADHIVKDADRKGEGFININGAFTINVAFNVQVIRKVFFVWILF